MRVSVLIAVVVLFALVLVVDAVETSSKDFRKSDVFKNDPRMVNQTWEGYPDNLQEERFFLVPDGTSKDHFSQSLKVMVGGFFKDLLPLGKPAVIPFRNTKTIKKVFTMKDMKKLYAKIVGKMVYNEDFFWSKRFVNDQGVVTPVAPAEPAYDPLKVPFELLYNDGLTFTALHSAYWLKKFRPAFDKFVDIFNTNMDCSTFFAPPSAKSGISVHIDTTEVFIVNLVGTKTFRLWDPALFPDDFPMFPHKKYKPSLVVENAPAIPSIEITLQPGDGLYIPHGWVHDVHTGPAHSVHLSCGHEPTRWVTLLSAYVRHRQDMPTNASAPMDKPVKGGALKWSDMLSFAIYQISKEHEGLRRVCPLLMALPTDFKSEDPGLKEVFASLVAYVEKRLQGQDLFKLLCETKKVDGLFPKVKATTPAEIVKGVFAAPSKAEELERFCEAKKKLRFPKKMLADYMGAMAGPYDDWIADATKMHRSWQDKLMEAEEYGRVKKS